FTSAILRLPSISTLFPYTTLFRSILARVGVLDTLGDILDRDQALELEAVVDHQELFNPVLVQNLPRLVQRRAFRRRDEVLPGHEDRKSTRLNSSHVSISYAVFCLK